MQTNSFDIIILGSGPAGLQAAIHAARRKVSVLVLGRVQKSSAFNAHIENYCCIAGESGADMLEHGRKKAEASGAALMEEDVIGLSRKDGGYSVETESGKSLHTHALILAMGVSRDKLGLEAEKRLMGRGISYCVDCDAGFYKDANVAVVGCGSAAVSGALTLLFYAKRVHLVCDKLEVADHLAERLKESAIELYEGTTVMNIQGEDAVSGISLDDGTTLEVEGVFIELGAKGLTSLVGPLGLTLDQETMRYIETDKKQETNLPGIYAAGDICGPPWQVAKAVGEGCVAGLEAAAYVGKLREEKQKGEE